MFLPATTPSTPEQTTSKSSSAKFTRSVKHDRSKRLCLQLLQLLEEFPDFKRHLNQAISEIRFEGGRDETKDRNLVMRALETGCATIEELTEDTGLPAEDCHHILTEFIQLDIVEIRTKGGKTEQARGRRTILYFLRHSSPGSNLF
jgi:hypothetical protein